jgi:hypothetical protein
MTKLYEIAGAYAALAERAEHGEDVADAMAEIGDALEVKAQNIAAIMRNFDADCEALAAEVKRLSARRDACANARERLREYVRSNMEAAGIKRIKCAAFTLSLQEYESVRVDDLAAVPSEYKRTKPAEVVADKRAILKAYKSDGEVVPGVSIVVNQSLIER